MQISSIDFLSQIGVLTYKMHETRLKVLTYNNVILYLYCKILQIIHTFDNIKGVGGGLYPLHPSKYASIVEIVFESKNQKYNVAWLKVVCSLSAGMACY